MFRGDRADLVRLGDRDLRGLGEADVEVMAAPAELQAPQPVGPVRADEREVGNDGPLQNIPGGPLK